jgi:beta-lactamase regulating signal transducer with metallopeptidase domain
MIAEFLAQHVWLQKMLPILVDAAMKGALLVLLAGTASYFLRNRSAAARHAVWTAAVIGHLAIPIFAVLLPAWRIPLLPEAAWMRAASSPNLDGAASGLVPPAVDANSPAASASTPEQTPSTPGSAPATGAGPRSSDASTRSPEAGAFVAVQTVSLASILAFIWLVGTLLVLLRLAVGTWRVGQLARDGARVEDGRWLSLTQRLANRLGVTRPLTLLRGESLAVPVTWGIVYPAVLLPHDADTWPEERRRFVLVHEMAHVKRFDALTQLLAQLSIAVFWFNPLVWLAAHRMRVEREHACDDYVLRDGTTPSLYAGELLEMVRTIGTPRHDRAAPAFAALAMARRSEFEGRMLAILDPRLDRHTLNRRGTVMTALIVAFLTLPLAALRPFGQTTGESTSAAQVSSALLTPVSAADSAEPSAKPAAPASAASSTDANCERYLSVSGSSTQILTGKNNQRETLKFVRASNGRCTEASLLGHARFSADETELTYLEPGGVARFREVAGGRDRSVVVVAANGGSLTYSAAENGRSVPFDAEMREWLSRLLPAVLREAGINVPARVARLRAQGGVQAVLRDIGQIQSTGAKRSHYEELLKTAPLRSNEASSVVSQAGEDLAKSSGDLSAVLQKVPPSAIQSPASRRAIADAIARIPSSGDKTNTLKTLAPNADRETLLMLARGAETIPSSGDKSRFLTTTASEYLTPSDQALRDAFFRTAATVQSDGDLHRVLIAAMAYGHGNRPVVMEVIRTTNEIGSSGDISIVLQSLADQRLLTPQTPTATIAVIERTLTMGSSGDRSRVLMSLARHGLLSTSAVRDAYTQAAMALPSDGDRANTLAAAARE